jgi:membrane-bound serine protease (ClpP class)
MDTLLVWGLVLIAAALLLFVLEIFVPSAGLIFLTATTLAIAGIVCLWRHDPMWGISGLLSTMVLAPTLFFVTLNLWRTTSMGRRALGVKSEEELDAERAKREEEARVRMEIMGATGVVISDLRPIGVIEIDGKRFDALSESVLIPAGHRVRVTVVEPHQIKVRPEK